MEKKETLIFRFVPTMGCNLKCSYCFLGDETKGVTKTLFDKYSTRYFIKSMENFKDHNVEFYMWGGEPFSIPETFELVKGLTKFDFVKWARIDHNMTKVEEIIKKCPSGKVKINCSWHTERFSFEEIWEKVMLLHKHDMVGMVNFVASDKNMQYLVDNNLDLDEIIAKFEKEGVYLNVAADFDKEDTEEYKNFITKYTTVVDYEHIHGYYPSYNVECNCGNSVFTVGNEGELTICANNKEVGNFFTGEIEFSNQTCPFGDCKSIISYPQRKDNDLNQFKHLDEYVNRNIEHRKNQK